MASIRKRKDKDNNYYIYYTDLDGKRRSKKAGKSKKLALDLKADIEAKLLRKEMGIIHIKKNLVEALRESQENIVKTKFPSTARRYVEIYETFIEFIINNKIKHVSDFRQSHFEAYMRERLEKIKPATLNNEIIRIKSFFKHCIELGYININPLQNIKRLRIPEKFPRFFSKEEVDKILEVSNDRYKDVFNFLLHTGIRRGELINLEWSDIDFQNRLIKIQVKEFWAPKGRRSRVIPMDDITYSILLKRKRLNENERWIFNRDNGNKLDGHLTDVLYKTSKKAGIENCNIHTFRHTFSSWLVQKGVPLYTVSKLLGHADYETTQIYAHLIPDTFNDAIKKLTE